MTLETERQTLTTEYSPRADSSTLVTSAFNSPKSNNAPIIKVVVGSEKQNNMSNSEVHHSRTMTQRWLGKLQKHIPKQDFDDISAD